MYGTLAGASLSWWEPNYEQYLLSKIHLCWNRRHLNINMKIKKEDRVQATYVIIIEFGSFNK